MTSGAALASPAGGHCGGQQLLGTYYSTLSHVLAHYNLSLYDVVYHRIL